MKNLVFPSMEAAEQGFTLLDLIPDTHAWLKDTRGIFVFGNRLFYERFGISSVQGLIGKSDYDIAPRHMADGYRSDDDAVLAGKVVTDRLELILDDRQSVAWFLTSKWPVYNPDEEIIGSLGISHHLDRTQRTSAPYQQLSTPIDYMCEHFAGDITIESIAQACNISVSALERRFRKHLHKTPHQYLNEVRLDNARQLLTDTDKRIGDIALETGFADHSHFTRAYSRRFGMTPRQARQSLSVPA